MTKAPDEKTCQALFAATVDALLVTDEAGTVVFSNPAAQTLFGYPETELSGIPVEQLVAAPYRAKHREGRADYTRAPRPVCLNAGHGVQAVRRDGSEFVADVTLSPLAEGKVLVTARNVTERAHRDEMLRQFSRVVEQTASTVVVTDSRGVIEYVNPRFSEVSGYSAEEAIGQRPSLLKSGHTTDEEYRQLWLTITGGDVWQGEFLNRRKDGTLYWESAIISPVRDERGLITHFVGIKDDITERKRTEAALRESEARFRATFEKAAVGIAHVAPDGSWLRVNPKLCEIVGYTEEELLQSGFQDITHPDDLKTSLEIRRRMVAGEADSYSAEKRYVRKDGRVVWVEFTVALTRKPDGTPDYFITVVEDIQARKQAQAALSESEAWNRAVIETAMDGFWMVDKHGRLLAVNDAYVRLSGYSREELLTMSIADLEAKESPEQVQRHRDAIRHRGNDLFETEHRKKSGEVWPVEVTTAYWQTGGGRFFCFLRDVSARKRGQAALQAMHAEMEQLMKFQVASQTGSAIAHELNQPLTAIASYAESALMLLHADNMQPAELRDALEGCAQQAERAGRVVRELLEFMKKGDVQTGPVNLNEVARRALARIEANRPSQFRAHLAVEPGLASVNANRLQVQKVLENLIQNGIEAMDDDGSDDGIVSVTVSGVPEANMAHVTVRDSGPGIDAHALEQVFEPFYTTKPTGLGVGLAISRAIVEEHGGQLWVESEPGAGASFHLTLPFAS